MLGLLLHAQGSQLAVSLFLLYSPPERNWCSMTYLETASRTLIEAHQLARLRQGLVHMLPTNPFYLLRPNKSLLPTRKSIHYSAATSHGRTALRYCWRIRFSCLQCSGFVCLSHSMCSLTQPASKTPGCMKKVMVALEFVSQLKESFHIIVEDYGYELSTK